MILVTDGAGFIGGNFLLDWLAGQSETVVNLNKLTYAGKLQTLASVQGDPSNIFVQGDIGDRVLVEQLLAQTSPVPWSTLPPKAMWTDPSTALGTLFKPTSA